MAVVPWAFLIPAVRIFASFRPYYFIFLIELKEADPRICYTKKGGPAGVARQSGRFSFLPFEDLKEIIDSKGISLVDRANDLPDKEDTRSDEELFREAMAPVREIAEYRSIPDRKKPSATAVPKSRPDREVLKALEEIVEGRRPVSLPDTQEYVEWASAGNFGQLARMLHHGRFAVQDCLDLHGMMREEAREAVDLFIATSRKNGLRCVKIIHGRGLRSPGGPVLKTALQEWLTRRFRKQVLAFATARPSDGGLGALYILLR